MRLRIRRRRAGQMRLRIRRRRAGQTRLGSIAVYVRMKRAGELLDPLDVFAQAPPALTGQAILREAPPAIEGALDADHALVLEGTKVRAEVAIRELELVAEKSEAHPCATRNRARDFESRVREQARIRREFVAFRIHRLGSELGPHPLPAHHSPNVCALQRSLSNVGNVDERVTRPRGVFGGNARRL